ncbi:OmpA family protein [Gangjinia marincola]|uniref:OmpA family protein n=1 Tax=Gangjinia marincola TaxID=578463 RepID=UPI0031E04872
MKKSLFFLLFTGIIANAQSKTYDDIQWACKVISSSQAYTREAKTPLKATGTPDVMMSKAGLSDQSFHLGFKEGFTQEVPFSRVKVGFCSPQKINKIFIAESHAPGSITKVTVYDEADKAYEVYAEKAKKVNQPRRLLQIDLPFTNYNVSAVSIEANTGFDTAINTIDGIGIIESVNDIELPVYLQNLGSQINDGVDDLAPHISADGKTIYFVRDSHPQNVGIRKNKDDQDIWVSTQNSTGEWQQAQNMGEPINNEVYNFPVSISPDEQTIYLYGHYDKYGRPSGAGISYSTKTASGWSVPKNIEIKKYYTKVRQVSMFMSQNKKYLLMAINPKSGKHLDLYVSFQEKEDKYGRPIYMGNTINTDANEVTPFLASDNKTLYFSSNGHGGRGSNDIFVTKRLDDTWTNWSTPVNLGAPINTPGYDADFSLSAKGDYGYLVTTTDTYGKADIAQIKLTSEVKPNPVVLVTGRVLNQKTNEPIGAEVVYELLKNGQVEGVAASDPKNGVYKVILPYGENYGYRANVSGFYPISKNLDLTQVSDYKEVVNDLYLAPIEKGETFRMNNIFFETAKYELLSESYPELDRLVTFLTKQKEVSIEISGHTDDVGNGEYNLELSQNRAQAVVNYLVEKGIDTSRIIARGYGEAKPVTTNDTEEGKQENRRVEFTIL